VDEPPMLQKSLGGQRSLGWIVPLEMVIFPLEMVIFHSYVYSGTLKLKNAILETSLCQKKNANFKKVVPGTFCPCFFEFSIFSGGRK
jgi:hypothetical protein